MPRGVKVQVLSGLPSFGVIVMNVKEIKSKKLYKEYSITIPFEEIDNKVNEKISNLIPTITISGFRKGKAPLNIVRKKYEDSILNEVLQNVVNTNTNNLIKNKKLNLFRQPKVDIKKFEKNHPLEIQIKIDLYPEIKLTDFKKIKLNNYEINLSKKNLDDQYKIFLETQKNYKKIKENRVVKKYDRVTINFSTLNKNVPDYLKLQKNIPIDTGSEQEILPGLNKLLISKMKQGDKKNFSVDLSKILKNNELNKVLFSVEVIFIEEQIKFKISEEYLKSNGFKNENELKEFLKNNTTQRLNDGLKQIEKKELMDVLNKEHDFDLPEGVLEEDFNEIWHRIEHAKKEKKLDHDDKSLTDDQLKKRYKKISERRVKLGALLQFVAKEEKISISDEELSKGIMQYTSQYPGQEKQIMEYFKKNPSAVENIRGPLLEDKIIDRIKAMTSKNIKKIDSDQYKKLEEEVFDIKRGKL